MLLRIPGWFDGYCDVRLKFASAALIPAIGRSSWIFPISFVKIPFCVSNFFAGLRCGGAPRCRLAFPHKNVFHPASPHPPKKCDVGWAVSTFRGQKENYKIPKPRNWGLRPTFGPVVFVRGTPHKQATKKNKKRALWGRDPNGLSTKKTVRRARDSWFPQKKGRDCKINIKKQHQNRLLPAHRLANPGVSSRRNTRSCPKKKNPSCAARNPKAWPRVVQTGGFGAIFLRTQRQSLCKLTHRGRAPASSRRPRCVRRFFTEIGPGELI